MNKVYCYCHFAGVYQCVRTRACVGVNRGGGGLCACVYVCVHGRYLEGLTVGGERERERERERESQVCVYSHVARYKGVASS